MQALTTMGKPTRAGRRGRSRGQDHPCQDGLSRTRRRHPSKALTCAFQQGQEQLVFPIWKERAEQGRAERSRQKGDPHSPGARTLCGKALGAKEACVEWIPETPDTQGTEPQLAAAPVYTCPPERGRNQPLQLVGPAQEPGTRTWAHNSHVCLHTGASLAT